MKIREIKIKKKKKKTLRMHVTCVMRLVLSIFYIIPIEIYLKIIPSL